jgi:uncharacterized protein YuzE
MKVVCDPAVDVLNVLLSDEAVAESDQDKSGVILDYDAGGNMVSFEILDASKRMANPMSVEYAITLPLRRPACSCWMGGFTGSTAHSFGPSQHPCQRSLRKEQMRRERRGRGIGMALAWNVRTSSFKRHHIRPMRN